MRKAAWFIALVPLAGCFAVFPIPNFSQAEGNACLGTSSVLGSRVGPNPQGQSGTVKRIFGASERCRENPARPILAEVQYDEAPK